MLTQIMVAKSQDVGKTSIILLNPHS